VLSVLVTTSRPYTIGEVMHWLLPLLVLSLGFSDWRCA